jgi:hypothetical protein
MRLVGCILGLILVDAAIAVAGAELLQYFETGSYQVIPAGRLWYELDAGSLNLVQAVIERYVWAPLWDPVILAVLQWPVWLMLGLPGLLLALLCARRRYRADQAF